MKTETTPGPWHVSRRAESIAVFGPKGEEVATFSGLLMPSEELANAHLIAAAPELLAALDAVASWMEKHRPLEANKKSEAARLALNSARAVLAKTNPKD